MADRVDGGAAFPTAYQHTAEGVVCVDHGGMSLRDWFAGQALSGMLVLPSDPDSGNFHNNCGEPFIGPARVAYRFADAMLAARKEGQS